MKKNRILSLFLGLLAVVATAQTTVDYSATVMAVGSTGDFAPYMIGSWDAGRVVYGKGLWLDAAAKKELDLSKRFSWSAGVEFLAGYGSGVNYWRPAGDSHRRQSPLRLHQLYGELKYRQVFLQVGMRESRSLIVDNNLSSGDLVLSNNARPIPGAWVGFLDFVDIPFTKGWVQIEGRLGYGRMFDDGYVEDQFNYFNGLSTADLWFTYKRCYFRTNPKKPFHVTVGMQSAGMFGGSAQYYENGSIKQTYNRGFRIKDLWHMFFPREGTGEGNAIGNSLGSWDLKAQYRFKNDSRLSAYFEWLFEDGSGVAKANGWDGLWGLQYDFGKKGIVTGLLMEYIDFSNQCGPIHYSPGDNPGSSITQLVGGADNYYNNSFYGPYANYGMAIGSPFALAPVYNTDGSNLFKHNRTRGFHAAVTGSPVDGVVYKFMISHQKAGGYGQLPAPHFLYNTSAMAEASWAPVKLDGFSFKGKIAFDAGRLRGNNFGVLLGVTYSGDWTFSKNASKSSK